MKQISESIPTRLWSHSSPLKEINSLLSVYGKGCVRLCVCNINGGVQNALSYLICSLSSMYYVLEGMTCWLTLIHFMDVTELI